MVFDLSDLLDFMLPNLSVPRAHVPHRSFPCYLQVGIFAWETNVTESSHGFTTRPLSWPSACFCHQLEVSFVRSGIDLAELEWKLQSGAHEHVEKHDGGELAPIGSGDHVNEFSCFA